MAILIGSAALKHWFPDFNRIPKDKDYVLFSSDEIPKEKLPNTEYLLNPHLEFYHHLGKNVVIFPMDLYTLKISHVIGWDLENNSWSKHLWDICFLKKKGCILNKELFYKLYEYWNTIHGKNNRSNLEMSSEDFFDNALPKDLPNHDYLHTLINPIPTYTKVLIGEVQVSEDKFNLLSFEDKCNLVREEVEVMAAERFQGLGFRHRYCRMLKKFIISHAPIWEALFCLENYEILQRCRHDFIKIINNQLMLKGVSPLK